MELVIATVMENGLLVFMNNCCSECHHHSDHYHHSSEYYYFKLLMKEKRDEFMKLLDDLENFGSSSMLLTKRKQNSSLIVDHHDARIDNSDFYELFTIEINDTKSHIDDELINSMTSISLEDYKPNEHVRKNSISVVNMKITLKKEWTDEKVGILARDILKPVKVYGIDTLSIRDFAEFRESSIKFLINFQTNHFLSNHTLFLDFQNSTSSLKSVRGSKKSIYFSPEKSLNVVSCGEASPVSPSSTEVKSSSAQTNSSKSSHGYVDISIDCLNIIIEIKHIHLGYVSFSRHGFIGIGNELLSERVSFQKRESKEPLGDLLDIIDETPADVMWEEWSVARLASVYNQQRNTFPTESFKFSKQSTPQTYYFEPIETIIREAQEQALKYQPSNNELNRILLVSIGRRLFYQVVTRKTDWNKLIEIK
ncbi:hypothetical protein C9374_013444 [Naegleria lovaniensis]|uniref:Uncharacterized protein n=1 Tax=Naegleria lovaniensis TaxID=51637 RepID=A0AA88KQN6_NAELO|nr:uncharacterized protein C9374_013444 [Naegleria lovaniensis]KAG2391959.1 hypothetical protein C9374_013444 [Naegleria lovaniensis]